MRSSLVFASLALVSISCGSSKVTDSALMLTPRHTETLQLNGPLFSNNMEVEATEIDLGINAMGLITWNVLVDMNVSGFVPDPNVAFTGQYQASYKDVSFATYRNLPTLGKHTIKNHLVVTKLDQTADTVKVHVEHLATGITGTAVLQKGRNGLVDVASVELSANRPVPVKLIDPNSSESWYEGLDGIWYYGLQKIFGLIDEGTITLNKAD